MELNSKIGHRNYAIIDESNLTAEEIEAVKKAKSFDGFFGVVPYEYGYNEEKNEWEIRFCRVFKTCGFTVVLDGESTLRFIKKGYFTEDEVSLMNKGNTKDKVVAWYNHLIYEEIWLKK